MAAFERLKLGELLLRKKLITKEQLQTAVEYQKSLGGKIGNIIVKLGFISDDQLTRELARYYGIGVADLANQILPLDLFKQVPREILDKHQVVPIHATSTVLTIALSDPTDYEALDELQFATGKKIETTLATRDSIKRALAEFTGQLDRELEKDRPVPEGTNKIKSAGKLRPASAGSMRALADAGESALIEIVREKADASGAKINTSMLTRNDLRAAVVPLLVKKGIITENELFDSVIEILKKKGVIEGRELVDRAKDNAAE
ncbi:MAG: hypothetical protein IT462_03035 [Planctomycetes bacterium]|nr:hypothetical protein [Planctomycetota bacterium]